MNLLLRSKTGLTAALLLLIATIYWVTNHSVQPSPQMPALTPISQAEDKEPSKLSAAILNPKSEEQAGANINTSTEIVWNSEPAQRAELRAWAETRGLYDTSNDTADDLKSYSTEALKELAASGNIKALHLLAMKAPYDESKVLLTKAAVYGSTFALEGLANRESTHAYFKENITESDKKRAAIESAAYRAVAKLRNDYMDGDNSENNIQVLERELNIKFTEADQLTISQRAKVIYDDLEAERIQLGLGKFDNSLPPVVQAYYKSFGVFK